MEAISNQLEKIVSQQGLTRSLPVSGKISSLEPEEQKILDLKYKSKTFGTMTLSERTKWTKGLLAKISVITGWVVPVDEILTILIDQFEKKLSESYPNVNPDEAEYAFRIMGTTLQDWGKEINLSLIDEVMIPYLNKRKTISLIEEQQKVKQIEGPKEDLSEKTMTEWWNSISEQVKKSEYKMEFIPLMLYDWKAKETNISVAEKKEYLIRAVEYRLVDLSNSEDRKALAEFNGMKKAGFFTGAEIQILKDLAKRMIVFDLMKND